MGLVGVRFKRRAFWVFLGGFLIGLALIHIGQERFVGNSQFLDSVRVERVGSLALDRQGLGTVYGSGCGRPAFYVCWRRLELAERLRLFFLPGVGFARARSFLCSPFGMESEESCCLRAGLFLRYFCWCPLT